jgi:hypothetical protein
VQPEILWEEDYHRKMVHLDFRQIINPYLSPDVYIFLGGIDSPIPPLVACLFVLFIWKKDL